MNSKGIITTYVGGTGSRNYNAVSVDASGNIYIADTTNSLIYFLTVAGVITTFAGMAAMGNSGDGGPATSAMLQRPAGVAVDSLNNVYIADTYNQKIRMVNSAGIITTYAGTGSIGSSGDGGPSTNALLNYPQAIAVDKAGEHVYVADEKNYKVRLVTSDGIITTFAGSGIVGYSSGDGGLAKYAQLGLPCAVAVDYNSGDVYIGDYFSNNVRLVTKRTNIITTYAGTGNPGFSGDGGAATSAQLYWPFGLALDSSGNVYIADNYNYKVRMVTRGPSSPSGQPTIQPSKQPSQQPTSRPTRQPSQRPTITSFTYACTGTSQTLSVPNNVASLIIDIAGAQGGGSYSTSTSGGLGGRVQTTYTVTPGSTLYINVGCQGKRGNGQAWNIAMGGWNGGGNGTAYSDDASLFHGDSGGGGGATDIRSKDPYFGGASRLMVAGGGGGGYGSSDGGCNSNGGGGGGLTGASISDRCQYWSCPGCCEYTYASGGTQAAGGVAGYSCWGGTDGALGIGGVGGQGAGGGGGYYGGGGGRVQGGGGGSSYVSTGGSNTIHTQGYNRGDGYAMITLVPSIPSPLSPTKVS